jgi:hypothetical protein
MRTQARPRPQAREQSALGVLLVIDAMFKISAYERFQHRSEWAQAYCWRQSWLFPFEAVGELDTQGRVVV